MSVLLFSSIQAVLRKLNDGFGYSICKTEFSILKMALRKIVIAAAIFVSIVNATPTIAYPLNSQVPTVARVSKPYTYTFPSSTFFSTVPITYTLSSGPSWLSLDSTTRTLSGTPSTGDVGAEVVTEVAIGLTATDASGSTVLNAVLVVSRSPAPVVSIPPSAQLPSFGVFQGPSTILFHPSTPFEFTFNPDTFSTNGGNSNFSYYAVTVDNTPLPSWVLFDQSTLSFSGQTPDYSSLIQPPQTFGIRLIVTDIEGFAGAFIDFYIEVGVHLLSFSRAEMFVNATTGENISFTGLSNNLQIDGRPANGSEISLIAVDTPSWLVFDNSTMMITGTAPSNIVPSYILVLATDIYGDTANATIHVVLDAPIFKTAIPGLNATIGTNFSYNLGTYLRNSSDIYMSANSTPSVSWLSFDAPTFVFSGQVPTTAQPSTVKISLTAASKSSHISESQTFQFSILAATVPSSSVKPSPSRTSKTPGTSQTATSAPTAHHTIRSLSRRVIAAIVTPITVVFAAIVLALFCYRKRRRAAKKRPTTPIKSEISAPVEARERMSLSSVEEIVLPPRVAAPDPLHLDTSGFGDHSHHALTTNEKRMSPGYLPDRQLRRSRTTTSMSGARTSELTQPESSKNRIRSYSENALSKTTETSWRSTQDSSYPTIRSSRTNSTQRLTRTYSNYSRKGHQRRSARVPSKNMLVEPVKENINSPDLRSESSILNLQDSSFSLTPLEAFSALSRTQSTLDIPDPVLLRERPARTVSTRRQSKFVSPLDRRRSGIGHGNQASISSLSSRSFHRRSSLGHGREWTGSSGQSPAALARNSKTWLTVASQESNRQSNSSALSEYSDTHPANNIPMGIRQVTKSPPPIIVSKRASQSTQASRSSGRPVSRRVGSSPFFGGSSGRDSRMSPKKIRMSYADSPTVPEESPVMSSLENVVVHGLRDEETPPRDSFGISYGMAREGTRQLKSFIQGQLHRSRTKDSIRSTQSRDSRFESAVPSIQSLHATQHPPIPTSNDEDYEDYLPSDEGSWENLPPSRDSQGNIIEYSEDESPELVTAAQAKIRPASARPKSKLFELSDEMGDMGAGARIVPGVGRRP
ncbi:Axial budding pattern protein, partial [Lachnellula suecica]